MLAAIRRAEQGVIARFAPKDLAGWHVCLDVIGALLDGKPLKPREDEWKTWHEKYLQIVGGLS
jgi:hypothetical protein